MSLFPFDFLPFGIKDLVETLIIALVLTYLYQWIRGSFAVPAVIGIIMIYVVNVTVSVFSLSTINFLLKSVLDVGVLAVFIIFQPEIRRLLYRLGQNTSFDKLFATSLGQDTINEVIEAVKQMAKTKTGALIVFAQNTNISELTTTGVRLDAAVSADLLLTIFNKNTPLHDGAVIIKNNRIVQASCYLPITENKNISSVFGTRHRAALGVSEGSAVFVVVVSEETGRISIAQNGSLTSGLSIQQLRAELERVLGSGELQEPEISFATSK